jgi:hypothetical protein
LVGAVFEGIGVSTGSYIGGKLMERIQGSATFRIFSYGAFIFFAAHVFIQWALTKLIGPYGKKPTAHVADNAENKSSEALEINKNGDGHDKLDDGFKEIDLTK